MKRKEVRTVEWFNWLVTVTGCAENRTLILHQLASQTVGCQITHLGVRFCCSNLSHVYLLIVYYEYCEEATTVYWMDGSIMAIVIDSHRHIGSLMVFDINSSKVTVGRVFPPNSNFFAQTFSAQIKGTHIVQTSMFHFYGNEVALLQLIRREES